MTERFAPGVMIDGERYEPPSWMWILAFAQAGCPWALEAIEKNEPAFKAQIRAWLRERKVARLKAQLQDLQDRQAAFERDCDRKIAVTLGDIDRLLEEARRERTEAT